jgi:hypothetical protein
MEKNYPHYGCLGCGKIFPAKRLIFRKVKQHMQICCPDKCEIPGLNNKCIVTGKNSEVKGEEAGKLREKLRQQHKQKKLEKKKMNEKQKREDYRYLQERRLWRLGIWRTIQQ